MGVATIERWERAHPPGHAYVDSCHVTVRQFVWHRVGWKNRWKGIQTQKLLQ